MFLNLRLSFRCRFCVNFSSAVKFLRLHEHAAAAVHASRYDRRKYVRAYRNVFFFINYH